MSPEKSTKEQKEFVRQQIVNSEIPRDSLPYHIKFEELFREYHEGAFPELSKNDYWLLILRATKHGNAKQLKPIKLPVVSATTAEKVEVLRLLPDSAGERDRLPYTTAFDEVYELFRKHTNKQLSKNDFWRLTLTVVKASRKPKPIDINPSNELSVSLIQELHRMNPWWKGDSMGTVPKFKRNIYKTLYENVTRGRYKIVALRGPRQVGKTVLQMQMIHDLLNNKRVAFSPQQILRVQFDDLSFLDITDPILTIVRWFENNVVQDTFNNMAAKGLPVYIFLDEFQNIDNWNAQLKYISDHGESRFFITGSSALRIIAGRESMAGRVQWHEINTLGLAEISTFRSISPLAPYREEINLSEWLQKDFWLDLRNAKWKNGDKSFFIESVYKNFCDFGGYPFCHKDEDVPWKDVEEFLVDTVVIRAIELDLGAKFESVYGSSTAFMDATLLKNAFRILCKYTGQSVTIEKLCKELNASTSARLKHVQMQVILEFFERSMLIKIIRSFEHRLKNPKESVKVCLCDHAIRKAWLKEDVPLYGTDVHSDLAGHIVEGIVGNFFKSIKQLGVSYFPAVGKEKDAEDEVDFILEIGAFHIPVEVKYRNNPVLGSGLKSFLNKEAYNAPFGLVITKGEVLLDYFHDERIIPISAKRLLMLK